MDIERLGVSDIVAAPHPVDELSSGHHAARVAQQHLQEFKFFQWQRDQLTGDGDLVALDVHPHRPARNARGHELFGFGVAAKHRLDAGQQLPGRVGLGDVVVGADLQSDHFVHFAVLRGQHDHRHG